MKRFTSILRCALAGVLFVCPGVRADEEPEHPKKPLLWTVEGNGLEKPSYLFGTIHLGAGPLKNLHPAAEKALDAADAVYTEIALDPALQMGLAMQMLRKDGKTLAESIGEELSAQLDEELKRINPALNAAPFQTLKTWAVAASLPMLQSQLQGDKALDAIIWEKASAAGKETAGIEKPEDQVGIFDTLEEEEQVAMLESVIDQMRKDREAGRDPVKDLVAAYVSGDVEAVEGEMEKALKALAESEHKELGERLMKRLLEDRDITMSATIDEALRKAPDKTHFFAAGAAHFSGGTSIRSHLEEKGYTVSGFNE